MATQHGSFAITWCIAVVLCEFLGATVVNSGCSIYSSQTPGSGPTWMKKVVSAARRHQRQGRTLGEAFTDDGVQPVVNSVLVFPQQLHHWVVRPAEDSANVSRS